MAKAQLSQEAHERLVAELAELKGPRRGQIRQAILASRQMGSIVENGDYGATKEEERLVEDRIELIESLLRNSQVVDRIDSGVVGAGALVTIEFADGEQETFLYGESVERGAHSVCTPASPLGRALAGNRKGAEVSYRTPAGAATRVRIVEVA